MRRTVADRAWFHLARGEPARALEVAAPGLADDPDDLDLRLIEVRALGLLGRYARALPLARELVGDAPYAWWAHAALARALGDAGRPAEAREAARHAVEMGPDQVGAWIALATAELEAGSARVGLRAAEEALAIDPESDAAALLRALALGRRGSRDEARAVVRGVLARSPESPDAHAVMAMIDLGALRLADAHDSSRRALAISADSAHLHDLHLHTVRARTPVGRLHYAWIALWGRLPRVLWWVPYTVAVIVVLFIAHGPLGERIGTFGTAVVTILAAALVYAVQNGRRIVDGRLRGDKATAHLYDHLEEDEDEDEG